MVEINIGDTDRNADWLKSLPGYAEEVKIHATLAKKYAGQENEPAQEEDKA